MVAINSFCYSAHKCFKETEPKYREIKKNKKDKGIVKNNKYNTNIVDKVMESINIVSYTHLDVYKRQHTHRSKK